MSPTNPKLDPKIRDQLKELHELASREADPQMRDQLKTKLDEVEAGFQRVAAAKEEYENVKAGRGPFFTWNAFVLGLGIVGALVGSFYFGLSKGAMAIVVVLVAFAIVGLQMLRIKSRVKKYDDSA